MSVDLYDFDKTVYPRDSASAFWLFCLARCPWTLLYLQVQFLLLILWGVRLLDTGRFKSLFFGFVALIPTARMVKRFWDRHER
ncbi:MAG: hypothetical protein LIO46_07950, partial [Clostridiales bacterium]|nr:hypothetical protein [Clostridiales bacterium]